MSQELNTRVKTATKWLTVGEVAAKLVTPISSMVLARLLTPDAFGVVTTLAMIISFAEIFTDTGFQKYLIPAGRPDMAYFGFTNKLLKGEKIQIYNYGNCRRDFTYVDDIVEGIVRVMKKSPEHRKGSDGLPLPPYAIYNIGGGQPENLLDFVQTLQEELVRAGVLPEDYNFDAHKELVPMQACDVPTTYADAYALERDFCFVPKITLREGLRKFAEWYRLFYRK